MTEQQDCARTPAELGEDQRKVLALIMSGQNVFFTGSAGCGKSFLLRRVVTEMGNRYGPSSVHVTASTGIAACNIGGTTIHNFAGVGFGDEPGQVCPMISTDHLFFNSLSEN